MSANQQEAHTGPVKTPNQLLFTVLMAFLVPVFVIIGLAKFVFSGDMPQAGSSNPELAIAQRLQKVGQVEIRLDDGNRPLVSGEEVYKGQCAACHATGVSGAPKFGQAGEWTARIATGFDALVQSALKGKGAMGPQGGGNFNDIEIARAVAYMTSQAGGNFKEPEAPKKDAEAGK